MVKSILIQARLSSNRFPQKMMADIAGIPLVDFVYRRCLLSKEADMTAVITSNDKSDDPLADYCNKHSITVFRGSLSNVLDRYIKAADFYGSDVICRVCGDSPFVDVPLIDVLFRLLMSETLDYTAPDKSTCIAGLDSEVVTINALKQSASFCSKPEEFEHVTPYIKTHMERFKTKLIKTTLMPAHLSGKTLTVDYPHDLALCNKIMERIGGGMSFTSNDVLSCGLLSAGTDSVS